MSRDVSRLAADAETAANDAVKGAEFAKKFAVDAARDRQRVEELSPDPQREVVKALAALEGGMLLRIGPRRNRWPELNRIDEQLVEFERRREELNQEINRLVNVRKNAPGRHAVALAAWLENGGEGERPESDASALDSEIEAQQAEAAAVGIRYNALSLKRAEYVRKRRKPMLDVVRAEKDEAAREYAALVDQLEAKRQHLLDLRATEVWCSIFPSEKLTNQPNTSALVGAKKRLQSPHLPGLQSGIVATSLFNLLRADVGFCSSVATAEQAAEERGVSVRELVGRDARWGGDGKADIVGPHFDAAWGGSAEEKIQADRVAAYTEHQRRTVWGDD